MTWFHEAERLPSLTAVGTEEPGALSVYVCTRWSPES